MGHSTLRFCGERRRRGRTCLSTPATLTRKLHKVVRLTDARSSDRRTRFAGWGLGGHRHGGGRSKVKAPLLAPPKLPPGQSAKHSSGSPAAVTRHWGRVAVGTARLFTASLSSAPRRGRSSGARESDPSSEEAARGRADVGRGCSVRQSWRGHTAELGRGCWTPGAKSKADCRPRDAASNPERPPVRCVRKIEILRLTMPTGPTSLTDNTSGGQTGSNAGGSG